MQQVGGTLAVQRFVLAGEYHQTTIAVFLAEIVDALGPDISILFRPVDLPFHVFRRKQIGVKNSLTHIAKETDPFRPIAAQTDAANQRSIVSIKLQHFIDFF